MGGSDVRRKVPSVDAILRSTPGQRASRVVGRAVLKRTLTTELDSVRSAAATGEEPPIADEILAHAVAAAARATNGQATVINATGVIIHTNLGRAPLAERAIKAVAKAAAGYTDLEVDRASGARGSRGARAELILAALTGAEASLIVNNCAAALVLMLAALAKGKKVLVSRGELIEIGGEFRIPDIMRASGAKLIEVGTTNRTRPADFRNALDASTAAILQVHPSNYRVIGFTGAATTVQLAEVASKAGVPLLFDVGSGLLDAERGFPGQEPSVHRALADGADLVAFSGDKLLGGPQAGCIAGRADLVATLRKHPLARAVRVDKLQAAAMEATLGLYATGAHAEIPVHRMIHENLNTLAKRAHTLAEAIGGDLEGAHVVRCESVVGGGSVPGQALTSWGVRVRCPDASVFTARLRTGSPSVFCRTNDDHVLLDVRTVTDAQVPHVARAVLYALEGDDLDDED
jgi:L-seryl-tRNA(Ser) seleniumtransferase